MVYLLHVFDSDIIGICNMQGSNIFFYIFTSAGPEGGVETRA